MHLFLLRSEVHRLAIVQHFHAVRGVIGREQYAAVLQGLPLEALVLSSLQKGVDAEWYLR